MSKVDLIDFASLQNENTAISALNLNNSALTEAIDNSLSRDGSDPNQMEATLDMNSNPIINLRAPIGLTEPLRKAEFNTVLTQIEVLLDHLAGTNNDFAFLNVYSNKASVEAADIDSTVLYLRTAGYTTAGDGGGALYVNRFGVTPTHPGYILSNNGFYFELVTDEVNVKTLGAIGDGATDDSTAIQNARLVVEDASQPDTLYFPTGTFITSSESALTFSNLTHLYTVRGDGPNSIIKIKDSANIDYSLLSRGPIIIKDLCFDGNKANGGSSSDCFLFIIGGNHSRAERVEVRNSLNLGITLAEVDVGVPIDDVKILDCYIHDNESCGVFNVGTGGTTNVVIDGCWFEDNYQQLSAITDASATNLTNSHYTKITNNTFKNNLNVNGGQTGFFDGCTHGVISGNTILQDTYPAGQITYGIEIESNDTLISNNKILGTQAATIVLNGDLTNILVTGNHLSSHGAGGIEIIAFLPGAVGILESKISNNYIGPLAGHGAPGGSPGISLQNTPGHPTPLTLIVTDNYIETSNQVPLSGLTNAWVVAGNNGYGLDPTVYFN